MYRKLDADILIGHDKVNPAFVIVFDANPVTGIGNVVVVTIVGSELPELFVGIIDTLYNFPAVKLLKVIEVNVVDEEVNGIFGRGSIV